jgi:hypothetical protein
MKMKQAVREIENSQEIVRRQYDAAVRKGDAEAVARLGALWMLFSKRLREMDARSQA